MKQVNVSIELEPELPAVTGDFIQLQQVFLNLFTNAVDAMEQVAPSQKRMRIRASRTADNSVQISFKDNGCGFAEEVQVRMLEPFLTPRIVVWAWGSEFMISLNFLGLGLWSYSIALFKFHRIAKEL